MKNIIVNAYPLRFSGALVILNQFIENMNTYALPNHMYYVFVDSSLEFNSKCPNIKFIKVQYSFLKKILFYNNFVGINKYLKDNKIEPHFVLSLANINTRTVGDIPNYVYFHQSITIYKHKWNILSVEEFKYLIYKVYYKYAIKRSLQKNTQVIVQLECIKDRYSKVYSIDKDRIITITPNVIMPLLKSVDDSCEIDESYINLIYPATPLKYKNHKVIIDSLGIVAKVSDRKVRLYLTCEKDELRKIDIPKLSNNVEIVFMGHVKYDHLINFYYKMDALLFPSFIESFGLPMIEAATSGIKILAADTDFANEVLSNYDGVEFIATFTPEKWATKIIDLEKNTRYEPLVIENNRSWVRLFEIINKI